MPFNNRNGWDALGNCHTGAAHLWRFFMHYYSFNIGDYLKATAHLTLEEDLTYRRLLDLYYDTESPISPDIAHVAKRLRVKPEWVESILKEFFAPTEQGWVNKRAQEEITKYQGFAEAGKRGAAVRWGGYSPPTQTLLATNNQETITNKHNITNLTSKDTSPLLTTSISNIVEGIAPLSPPYSPPIGSLLPPHDQGKAWAYRLKEREEAGEVLTLAQKRNWREALRVKV